jgi:hypothetical protein
MTVARLEAVGLCAHYSSPGDWAFNFALGLARRNSLQLNVFHFLADPYNPEDRTGQGLTRQQRWPLIIDREKELRFYYEEKLGEFVDAGFRVCEDREWKELHKCLTKREFQILVLPYPSPGATFGGRPIEEFADCFVCPVVLVGPGSPDDYHLNRPAALMAGRLGLVAEPRLENDAPRFSLVEPAAASPRSA